MEWPKAVAAPHRAAIGQPRFGLGQPVGCAFPARQALNAAVSAHEIGRRADVSPGSAEREELQRVQDIGRGEIVDRDHSSAPVRIWLYTR